jgi:hypothetical protein
MTIGTQIDLPLGSTASSAEIASSIPKNLSDLLRAVQAAGGTSRGQLAMFRTTVGHVMRYLNKPPNEIDLGTFAGISDGLRGYLLGRKFKPNAVRSYLNYARILVKKAKDLGWGDGASEVQKAWESLYVAIRGAGSNIRRCRSVLQYAVRRGIRPSEFGEECLADWKEAALKRGISVRLQHL